MSLLQRMWKSAALYCLKNVKRSKKLLGVSDQIRLESDHVTCKELAHDVIFYIYGKQKNFRTTTQFFELFMRRLSQLSSKHEIAFTGIVNRLTVTKVNAYEIFVAVCAKLFKDGTCNWGRILAVYAFAGWLVKGLGEEADQEFLETFAELVGDYVSKSLICEWIQRTGGWEIFIENYSEEEPFEQKIWRSLVWTFLGLGTLAVCSKMFRVL